MRTCIILDIKDIEEVRANGNNALISTNPGFDIILTEEAAAAVMDGLKKYFKEKGNLAKSADDDGGEDRPADPRP